MVYDFTEESPTLHASHGEPGYSIYRNGPFAKRNEFAIFTDDGRGNGQLVCTSPERYWARRIAHALDLVADHSFDADGNVR